MSGIISVGPNDDVDDDDYDEREPVPMIRPRNNNGVGCANPSITSLEQLQTSVKTFWERLAEMLCHSAFLWVILGT